MACQFVPNNAKSALATCSVMSKLEEREYAHVRIRSRFIDHC